MWCEENGFVAREFSVGWDAARRLVDASLPFALETKAVDGGHLQTVAGYDEMRGTLLLEDPGSSDLVEAEAVPFLESQRLTGPRGLVFVPATERERLASLDLPEAELHDRRFAAEAALTRWDRDRAAAELSALEAQAPGHVLTWMTRMALAGFDGDQVERHRAIDALLALFPKDGRILRWKLGCLREAGRREERIELLRGALEAGVEGYAFRRELASELMQDARTLPLARRLLWLAHRNAPRDTRTLRLLADLETRDGDDERSLDVRRFAAACEDTDEELARAWFDAAVVAGRADEAREWLERRFRVLGARSSAPAVTLSQVLERLARTEEALSVLREAVARRPDDGSLRLHLATAHARRGDRAAAREHLEAARATTRPGEWRRTEASLLERDGDLVGAEAAWRQVLEREPLALDAHREVAWHLGSREGPAGAVAYLEEVCARYPHHDGLATHLLSWVREQDPERAETLTRRHIDAEPADAWWRRERALLLRRLGRLEEAIVEAAAAREIAPRAPASHGIAASLEAEAGRTERAREGYREAIGLDVDYAWAVDRLLELAGADDRRREELAFVRAELVRQTSTGDGLTAWVEGARRLFEPEALRVDLVALRDLRPDLCEAWTELARQTLDAGMEAEAEHVAEEATRRFPLRHEAWQALATVRRRRGDATRATEAVRRAVEIGPDQADAWFSLAAHLTDAGETEAAETTLREGVRRHPFDPALALRLARARWDAGDETEGWTIAARIVTTRPSAQRAWDCLDGWATTPARRADLVGLARAWSSARPGEAQAWTRLADVLPPSDLTERTAALERAIALNPRDPVAYDLLATVLADAERYEEARGVLKRGPWPEAERPVTLEGRDAWVLARQGRQADAIARMSAVVERSAGYWWGWSRLAEWAEKADDTVAWERASRALLRLAPADSDALVVAADLAARMDRGAEAREHFQRVLALEPGHLYAARRLLDLARQAGDLDALNLLAERLPAEGAAGGTAAAARTLAAALRGDPATCTKELAPLVRSGDVSPAVAEIVDAALSDEFDGRMQRGYARVLDRAVESDEVGPAFARAWMLRRVRGGRWSAVRRFDAWLPRLGESVEHTLGEVLDEAGERQAARRVVPRLLRRHRHRLREEPTLWGKVGYALVSSGRDVDAARWLAGGETRDDAEPWMLWNYNLSLRRLGRHREAEAVSLAVVSRGVRDDRWGDHVGHAAYGEALAGRYASARSILAKDAPPASVADVPARRRLLFELASSLCAVGEAAATGDGATRLRTAQRRLRVLAEETTDAGDDDRKRYAEGLRAMGTAAGVRVPFWRRRWPGPKPASERGGWKRNLWYLFLASVAVRLLLRLWR